MKKQLKTEVGKWAEDRRSEVAVFYSYNVAYCIQIADEHRARFGEIRLIRYSNMGTRKVLSKMRFPKIETGFKQTRTLTEMALEWVEADYEEQKPAGGIN
jgi:hypothetical protein